ncbi:MAG TPA: NAD-dependent epimerase/dehydratase family protein [Egicoccus sp.]|nr:NAD-dependent epimerase/dehydratase family protein [Egicoccus sp.]HSK22246.1 NAD-dependent epimerase/dehydratase family protein [Egicoccus sp.]
MGRIVVTGATGFVGGRIARALRERDDEVVALVRTPSEGLAGLGIEQPVVALDDVAGLTTALQGADGIVHAAATAGPDLETARTVNTVGTRSLVDAAMAAWCPRFVHVSTTSVYDRDASGDGLLDEDAPLAGADAAAAPASSAGSPYAITKAEAEAEVARGGAQGLSVAILRPPAVLGAGRTSTWGTRMPERFRDGELPAIPPATTFGWVHVDDLVEAALVALDSDAQATVNVVGGHTSFGEYLAALREFVPAPPATAAASDDQPWRGSYATHRLPEVFGFRPNRSFAAALAEIAAFWRESH